MRDLLSRIQPYIQLVSAAASLTVLVFLVQLLNLMRAAFSEQVNAVKEQKKVTEERLQKAQDDLARTETWHRREMDVLEQRLAGLLSNESITVGKLVATDGKPELGEGVKESVNLLLREISALRGELPHYRVESWETPDTLLNLANGFASAGDWLNSAYFYGKYIESDPKNWEVHYLRAVALANSREGSDAYRDALVELSAAIAYAPVDIDNNLKARLYGFRGSDLKRLGRAEEAENDLLFAQKLATADHETEDIAYNLAGVYSMMERREDMIRCLQRIAANPKWRSYIQQRREYFSNYWEDREFRALVGLPA